MRFSLSSLLLSCLLLAAPSAVEAARAQFRADTMQGDGWSASGVVATVVVDKHHRPGLDLRAAQAVLPAGMGSVKGLHLHCPRLLTRPGHWRCKQAVLHAHFPVVGEQTLHVDFDYQPNEARLKLSATGLKVATGAVALSATADGEQWKASLGLNHVDLAQLQTLSNRWAAWPAGTWDGSLSAQLQATGTGGEPSAASATFQLHRLDYSSADGLTATSALVGAGQLQWATSSVVHTESTLPTLAFDFSATRGQLYLDPVFLDTAQTPFELHAAGKLQSTVDGWQLVGTQAEFKQPGLLAATAAGTVDFGTGPLLRNVAVELEVKDTAKAWPLYAGPFLASTDFKDLTATGDLNGQVLVRAGSPARVTLSLKDLTFADPAGTLELRSVSGALRWSAEGTTETEATALSFAGGRFYGLPFGAAQLNLQTQGRDARLLKPFTLPILDGGLQVDTFRVRHAGEPDMWLRLDAVVLPIDMAALSKAFGWPVFGGKLAGRIPKAALDDGVLTLGGNLEAQVFGGQITLQNLRLQDALGRFPQFQADITLRDLDLALVTGTFEFGYISGRLEGEVNELQLFDWRPVAFDARLATPPNYRGDRRITPRAVQNLSSLGGGSGVTSALSGSFLRVFKDFKYRQLGIACRLEQDVCQMGGVAPAPGGYYLIEGAGLPRINLIGSQGRVAWSKLLRQLERLGQGAALEVK
jgi:hypothetical protein